MAPAYGTFTIERKGELDDNRKTLCALVNFKDKFVFIIGGESKCSTSRYRLDDRRRQGSQALEGVPQAVELPIKE